MKNISTRNKELNRVKGMIKRLESKGYEVVKSIENLTTRQLRNIRSGKDLVSRGLYRFSEIGYEELRRKQLRKRIVKAEREARAMGYNIERMPLGRLIADEKILSIRGTKGLISYMAESGYLYKRYSREVAPQEARSGVINISDVNGQKYDSSGTHIPRNNVYTGSMAAIQMDMLLSIAEYGERYRGVKGDVNSDQMINKSGRRLKDIIVTARLRHSDEEILEYIESHWAGNGRGIDGLAKTVERLVLAVYDEEYRTWASGLDLYEQTMEEIEDVLNLM